MVKDMLETLVNLPGFSVRVNPDGQGGFEVKSEDRSQWDSSWNRHDSSSGATQVPQIRHDSESPRSSGKQRSVPEPPALFRPAAWERVNARSGRRGTDRPTGVPDEPIAVIWSCRESKNS